jgi:4-amino-4-deoxy-L-arabinose transferase-like glycosyltransferase
VALIGRPKIRQQGSVLLQIVGFGLLVFSLPLNKLPEYLLPLLPSLAAVMGLALADTEPKAAKRILAASGALAGLAPLLANILPQALAEGITKASLPSMRWEWIVPVMICLLVGGLQPKLGVATVAVAVTAGVIFLKIVSLPQVDEAVSARPVWKRIAAQKDQVCLDQIHRRYEYGLNYYAATKLPDCHESDRPIHLNLQPRMNADKRR